jgi:hypothetical protein
MNKEHSESELLYALHAILKSDILCADLKDALVELFEHFCYLIYFEPDTLGMKKSEEKVRRTVSFWNGVIDYYRQGHPDTNTLSDVAETEENRDEDTVCKKVSIRVFYALIEALSTEKVRLNDPNLKKLYLLLSGTKEDYLKKIFL